MSTKRSEQFGALPLCAGLCLVFSILSLFLFAGNAMRVIPLLVGLGMLWLLATRDLGVFLAYAVWPLTGYVLFSGLSVFWAMAGKFQLREYSRVFIAFAVFLFVLTCRFDRRGARRIGGMLSGSAAIFAFLSVEWATTNLLGRLLALIPGLSDVTHGFLDGSRLSGVLGNSNIEASLFGFGVLMSIALVCGAEDRRERALYMALLALNAYAFVLVFSMGAIGSFLFGVILYLAFAGKYRTAALVRMITGAGITLVCVFAAYPLFNRGGAAGALPLLIMLADAAICAALEWRFSDRLLSVLEGNRKLAGAVLIGAVSAVALYAALGITVTGSYTFGGELSRAVRPVPGAHTLSIDADGAVRVTVTYQNRACAIMSEFPELYSGSADGAVFEVPEDAIACYYQFEADPGVTLRAALIDGTVKIPLKYLLLPNFAANRIQGLWASHTAIERTAFITDGVKLWRLSPIVGSGMGAFETGVSRVQEFPYTTRYVHNHYIQVLLEGGVIGLALWAANLLVLFALLFTRRRTAQDSEFAWLYPALWAMLAMLTMQSITDVSLSIVIFQCYAYAVFGMIVRVTEPRRLTPGKQLSRSDERFVRVMCLMLPLLFLVSLSLNLWAGSLRGKSVSTLDEYFSNLATAARVDLYEYNDSKLSYVLAVVDNDREDLLPQANEYAEELSRVQSNAIPYYLIAYYLNTKQYERSIDEAKLAATYSAAAPDTWNKTLDLLSQGFMDRPGSSPLMTYGDTLIPQLMEYYQLYENYNASAMRPLELNERSLDFFRRLLLIDRCDRLPASILACLTS